MSQSVKEQNCYWRHDHQFHCTRLLTFIISSQLTSRQSINFRTVQNIHKIAVIKPKVQGSFITFSTPLQVNPLLNSRIVLVDSMNIEFNMKPHGSKKVITQQTQNLFSLEP